MAGPIRLIRAGGARYGRRLLMAFLLLLPVTTAQAVTFTTDTLIDTNDYTYDNMEIIVQGCTVTINGTHAFVDLFISDGGVVTHSASTSSTVYTMNLTIHNHLSISEDSAIDVTGKGHPARFGNMPGLSDGSHGGGGAGHGGAGGAGLAGSNGGEACDSLRQPIWPGSGGGDGAEGSTGGTGGGMVTLTVYSLTLDGSIRADGTAGTGLWAGGGAGGGVYIGAAWVAGEGSIAAHGGAGGTSGGGGAGGRISLLHTYGTFSGSMAARGGGGYTRGGAGTAFLNSPGVVPQLLRVDNGGNSGGITPLTNNDLGGNGVSLVVSGAATVRPFDSIELAALYMASGARCVPKSSKQVLSIHVRQNATLEEGAFLDADAMGHPAQAGSGAGVGNMTWGGGGGGYGGFGGAGQQSDGSGGVPYSVAWQPADFGSGGGNGGSAGTDTGGAGGGSIGLYVDGQLTLNGTLRANGATGSGTYGGGGSGGCINVFTNTLVGTGSLSACGGVATYGGGGAGGRISVVCTTNNTFAGTSSASGGEGHNYGGPGTTYSQIGSANTASLRIDNAGHTGQTLLTLSGISGPLPDVLIGEAAIVQMGNAVSTLNSLHVQTGACLTTKTSAMGFALVVEHDATIEAGAVIDATGKGYTAHSGSGAGISNSSYGGGGASHGGTGGSGIGNTAPGGIYGALLAPSMPGSGGGDGYQSSVGGYGGGAVGLTVDGTLTFNGTIGASGTSGTGLYSGGGSGGSVWITADTLTGNGSIAANGGAGVLGGGGGGGRIAIVCRDNTFAGSITATGATGYTAGGAGTIYTGVPGVPGGQLRIDNGGISGKTSLQGSDWSSLQDMDLTIGGAAHVQSPAPSTITVRRLHIAPNGRLAHLGLDLVVTEDAVIDAGGAIRVDGGGSTPGSGIGAGANSSLYGGGGGGHGGYGGTGEDKTAAGTSHGSLTAPIALGGAGGNGYQSTGGTGGGPIKLTVNGNLTLNGSLSANGNAPVGAWGGGGAGGSIWVTAGTIAGAGSITADGGTAGAGGGGGGGRIALYYESSSFAGTTTAYGGNGYVYGGAGTIYTKANLEPHGQLLIVNGGSSGMTLLSITELPADTVDLTVLGQTLLQVKFAPTGITFHSLRVGGGAGVMAAKGLPGRIQLVVETDATVEAGGTITVDGLAGGPQAGPGAGQESFTYGGGGAGYGGMGGAGLGGAVGGAIYGAINQATGLGSGGGYGYQFAGGTGGGAIMLNVIGTLLANGTICANGSNGTGLWGGGGSGGSIKITAGTLEGSGSICANGGTGVFGGGGGGGRLALSYLNSTFDGTIGAAGGEGYTPGEPGTIFWPGDANADGSVDVTDLLFLIDSFGKTTGDEGFDPGCDFNGDGTVDVVDLLVLVGNFGRGS